MATTLAKARPRAVLSVGSCPLAAAVLNKALDPLKAHIKGSALVHRTHTQHTSVPLWHLCSGRCAVGVQRAEEGGTELAYSRVLLCI